MAYIFTHIFQRFHYYIYIYVYTYIYIYTCFCSVHVLTKFFWGMYNIYIYIWVLNVNFGKKASYTVRTDIYINIYIYISMGRQLLKKHMSKFVGAQENVKNWEKLLRTLCDLALGKSSLQLPSRYSCHQHPLLKGPWICQGSPSPHNPLWQSQRTFAFSWSEKVAMLTWSRGSDRCPTFREVTTSELGCHHVCIYASKIYL